MLKLKLWIVITIMATKDELTKQNFDILSLLFFIYNHLKDIDKQKSKIC